MEAKDEAQEIYKAVLQGIVNEIEDLPLQERIVFACIFEKEKTFEETATELGITIDSVRVKWAKVRHKLKFLNKDYYGKED